MPKILIVDDSITIREYIKEALSQTSDTSWHFFEAENGREALDAVHREKIDLVLCDVMMPEMDGFAFLERMKEEPDLSDLPVIMLTAVDAVEKKVRGLQAGASDYLVKPLDESELVARVQVQLKIKQLQDKLKKADERHRKLSITDYLTKIYNRRHFMQILSREFDRARRYDQPLSLIILDIDHFKLVNDEFGHQQGDRILVELARLLKNNIRSHDIIARYGGEEFVVLLPGIDVGDAETVADKLRGLVEQRRFSGVGGRKITVSMGVCSYPGRRVITIDDLIARADKGLYGAKRKGRNRVVVYQSGRRQARVK